MTIRPDGVDHPSRRQVPGTGGHGFPDRKAVGVCRAAKFATLLQQERTGSPVDGPVNPSAAEQRAVGSVDDRVNELGGDVALDALDQSVLTRVRSVTWMLRCACGPRTARDRATVGSAMSQEKTPWASLNEIGSRRPSGNPSVIGSCSSFAPWT